jgi:osmotically-inducible protein OsmY
VASSFIERRISEGLEQNFGLFPERSVRPCLDALSSKVHNIFLHNEPSGEDKKMSRPLYLIHGAIIIALLIVIGSARHQNLANASQPKDDATIQKCIIDKFTTSESLKSQGLSATVSGGVATLTGQAKNMGSKGAATNVAKGCGAKKVTNQITIAPPDDNAIQKCIADKFAASPSLKSQGFSVAVSGGVATLTGTAKDAGSKGAATNIAKKCGAKTVTNNITSPAVAKPTKPTGN